MPLSIPALNALWRPGLVGPAPLIRDDRELIRQYAGIPATEIALFSLTESMNDLARVSSPAVTQVQGWINTVEDLDEAWQAKVEEGTAHLGNQDSYEGPIPGKKILRADMKSKLDVVEWDTSLLKVKMSGSRPGSTEGEVLSQRMGILKQRIFDALGICEYESGSRLVRS